MLSIDNPKHHLLDNIEKCFLCAANTNLFDWVGIRKHLEGDFEECQQFQKDVIVKTVKHSLVSRLPIKYSYQQHFLKKFISTVEILGLEVAETVYNSYVDLIQESDDKHCLYYRHFKLPDYNTVSVAERISCISNGTTGLQSWQGAVALSDWLIQHHKQFENKSVLEIGSGSGLAGLILLSIGKPSSYYFSDCHHEVLKQLHLNLNFNLFPNDSDFSCENNELILYHRKLEKCDVKILNLDWEFLERYDEIKQVIPDVIIGSDLVYDDTLFLPLCKTLEYFLKGKHTFALLVSTIRNENTYNRFCQLLQSRKLSITEIPSVVPQHIPFQMDVPIKFIEIRWNAQDMKRIV